MESEKNTDLRTREMYSSAFTLSDMEVFLFPELLYASVLANIMSPVIWEWRKDSWFAGIATLSFERQMQRLKQYIMDNYSFNLDLETWGLTSKQQELARFAPFVDPDVFSRSNALFGYEGDKYYYDMDIRQHFGLDKYTTDVIPYWKTETVEAMDAFRFKPGYHRGAGECVSLSTLYAAAAFVLLGVPLEDIFLMATPLHSQTFIQREQGVITNNRRIVTKSNWFNGTELSTKARRALEKERVTIVGHCTGYIHVDYPEATLDPTHYERFRHALQNYLSTRIDFEIFANFLRVHERYRKYFQFEYHKEGHVYYLNAEILYRYEHGSKCRVGDASRKKLLDEVEMEEFFLQPDHSRYQINIIEEQLNGKPLLCKTENAYAVIKDMLSQIPDIEELSEHLKAFACIQPRLPKPEKHFHPGQPVVLSPQMSREEILAQLQLWRSKNSTVDLAFYVNRQVDRRGWDYFLKASLERNPVSVNAFLQTEISRVHQILARYPDESIYAGDRLATPDEVFNYQRGDGIEKAVCLMNVLKHRFPGEPVRFQAEANEVRVTSQGQAYVFSTSKVLEVTDWTV